MTKRLPNDCFALPPGVDWTPVETALARLEAAVSTVAAVQMTPRDAALGLIAAQEVKANSAHPPFANAAVDGYAFAYSSVANLAKDAPFRLPILDGRASAGHGFAGHVPAGHALRILTGAPVPKGADTVVLQEEVEVSASHITLQGLPKSGANARPRGEDIKIGDVVVPAGRRINPMDLGVMASAGVLELSTYKPLRVGVLSTGDEVSSSNQISDAGIFDANRPILLALLKDWGFAPVDLGRAPDIPKKLQAMLQDAAQRTDAILTSGGASAGDEDHIASAIKSLGRLDTWRIAIKPGRPLALGMIGGVPIFGLPGNPVAAFVCSLIFARPVLGKMAGAGWHTTRAYDLRAAFSKTKKPGRMEYLRARLNQQGNVEAFASEGSGRITGLSWADGLVELGAEARTIEPGDIVRYLPFVGFRP